jgi:probable rRNA maturation factor
LKVDNYKLKDESRRKPEHKIFIERNTKSILCDNCINVIKRAVNMTLCYEQVDVPCIISVLITDDEGIKNYNYEYRGIDKPTDVLSFPMQTFRKAGWSGIENLEYDENTRELPLGDIILSIETVKKHAIEYGNTIKHETAYMIIHSVLHLLGYNHSDKHSEKIMNDKSKTIMPLLGSGEEYYI